MKVRDIIGISETATPDIPGLAGMTLDEILNLDLLELLVDPEDIEMAADCGEVINSDSTYRQVYEHAGDRSMVIKVEKFPRLNLAHGGDLDPAKQTQNPTEFQFWEAVKNHPDKAKWFVPCVRISGTGFVMHQKRAGQRGKRTDRYPAIFRLLSDGNPRYAFWNWGAYGGHPVLVDYGNMNHAAEKHGTDFRGLVADETLWVLEDPSRWPRGW